MDQRRFPLPLTWRLRRARQHAAAGHGFRPTDTGAAQPTVPFCRRGGWRTRLPLRLLTGTGPAAAQFRVRSRFRGFSRAPRQRQRKEKQTKSTSTHVPPPQGLCGDRVFRLPGYSAGPTGPSTPTGPIRTTPASRKGGPDGPLFRHSIFSFDRPRPFSFRCLEKKTGADPPRGPRAPARPAGQGTAPDDTPPSRPPHPSGFQPSTFPWWGKALPSGTRPCGGISGRDPLIPPARGRPPDRCLLPSGEGSPPGLTELFPAERGKARPLRRRSFVLLRKDRRPGHKKFIVCIYGICCIFIESVLY